MQRVFSGVADWVVVWNGQIPIFSQPPDNSKELRLEQAVFAVSDPLEAGAFGLGVG
jgi:hypothetical protein